jgi:hypothetical protein
MPTRSWTPERFAKLKELWTLGKTASQCCDELNANGFAALAPVTRSATIAKARRGKLESRRQAPSLARARRKYREAHGYSLRQSQGQLRAIKAARKATEATEMSKTAEELRPAKLTRLADLESNMCRFPYEWKADDPNNDGLSVGYCGRMVAHEGVSYCGYHLWLCTSP